jgi:hypothetical protein
MAMNRTRLALAALVLVGISLAVFLARMSDSPAITSSDIKDAPTGNTPSSITEEQPPEASLEQAPTPPKAEAPPPEPTKTKSIDIETRPAKPAETNEQAGEKPSKDEHSFTFSGCVVDHLGQPVPDADVIFFVHSRRDRYEIASACEPTNERGEFSGTGVIPSAGDCSAWLRAECANTPHSEPFRFTAMTGRDYANIILTVPAGAKVTARVVNEAGEPVPAAAIRIIPCDDSIPTDMDTRRPVRIVESDAKGSFSASGLGGGRYFVIIVAEGYEAKVSEPDILIQAGETNDLDDFVLRKDTAVRFRLVSAGKQPTGKLQVKLYLPDGRSWSMEAAADEQGDVLLVFGDPRVIELEITMAGYKPTPRLPVAPLGGLHLELGEIPLEPG